MIFFIELFVAFSFFFASMGYIKFLFLKLNGHSSDSYLGRDDSFSFFFRKSFKVLY